MSTGAIVASHFKSHGETMFAMLENIKGVKNKAVIVDEPESGLSLRSQNKIVDLIKQLIGDNNQIFIATHNEKIMHLAKEVLSLEHKTWMTSADFIETQKQ